MKLNGGTIFRRPKMIFAEKFFSSKILDKFKITINTFLLKKFRIGLSEKKLWSIFADLFSPTMVFCFNKFNPKNFSANFNQICFALFLDILKDFLTNFFYFDSSRSKLSYSKRILR